MNPIGILFNLFIINTYVSYIKTEIVISIHDLGVLLQSEQKFILEVRDEDVSNVTLNFTAKHDNIVEIQPPSIIFSTTGTKDYVIKAIGKSAGRTEVFINSTSDLNLDDVYLRVTVYKRKSLVTLSMLVGWVYFLAWSISYYPQIRFNYNRQSAMGLHIDYFVFSFLGVAFYALFNVVLYIVPEIQNEYYQRYPTSLIPVHMNDVLFSVHGTFMALIIVGQFIKYEGGNNPPLSTTAKILLGLLTLMFVVFFLLSAEAIIPWLDFLNYCASIGIMTSLLRFIPQVLLNFRHKAAIGISITTVLFDVVGGIFSILQMIIDSYNYDDWISMFGDFSKFGLGLNSLIFDLIILFQYYALYKHKNYEMH